MVRSDQRNHKQNSYLCHNWWISINSLKHMYLADRVQDLCCAMRWLHAWTNSLMFLLDILLRIYTHGNGLSIILLMHEWGWADGRGLHCHSDIYLNGKHKLSRQNRCVFIHLSVSMCTVQEYRMKFRGHTQCTDCTPQARVWGISQNTDIVHVVLWIEKSTKQLNLEWYQIKERDRLEERSL